MTRIGNLSSLYIYNTYGGIVRDKAVSLIGSLLHSFCLWEAVDKKNFSNILVTANLIKLIKNLQNDKCELPPAKLTGLQDVVLLHQKLLFHKKIVNSSFQSHMTD